MAAHTELAHADNDAASAGGFDPDYMDYLFPDYKDVRPGAPELVTDDQGWVKHVMQKVHKSPMSRIRTRQNDIRTIDEIRAKGYGTKGSRKALSGNFSLVRRTTDPQTVYVKNALHRDDIVDITDFDYVAYLYSIDRLMLDEEIAKAIMFGDGREEDDPDKISPSHIRPIYGDDSLYTIYTSIDDVEASSLQGLNAEDNFGENFLYTEALIETILHARERYKGTGTPDFYCSPALLNRMLLARDITGRRVYNTKADLVSALNVNDIFTVEQLADITRETSDGSTMGLLGIIVNLADYNVGSTKGGEISHFTQFDLNFNQELSLIETRCSGALTRIYSAIAIETVLTEAEGGDEDDEDDEDEGVTK